MAIVQIELRPETCRLRGSWQLTASELAPAGSQRAIVLEGVPLLSVDIDLEIVAPSGSLPMPDRIRFTATEVNGNSEKEVQVVYCPEVLLENVQIEPLMLQVAVNLPTRLFDALWQIVREEPIGKIKVGTSIDVKDDVTGHFPTWEIQDLAAMGYSSTAGHRFWFEMNSDSEI